MNYQNLGNESNNESAALGRKPKSQTRSNFNQLKLLLWKNVTLQRRAVISTIIEICVPTLFAIILMPIRRIVVSDQYSNDTFYKQFPIEQLPPDLLPDFGFPLTNNASISEIKLNQMLRLKSGLWDFAFAPNDSLTIEIMNKVADDISLNVYGFSDEQSMVDWLSNETMYNRRLGGAFFMFNGTNYEYKIRLSSTPRNSGENGLFKKDLDWKTNLIYSIFPILGPREKGLFTGGDPGYYREGFLQIQKSIDMALISHFNSSANIIDLKFERFPFPPYTDDKFIAVIQALFPFIMILSFIYTVIMTAKQIVYEKETGIKEAMKLMGMKPWIYWLSWYIKTFVLLLPSLIFMICAYKIKLTLKSGGEASIIDKTDPILFTLFMLLYASSLITFTFMCSTFFKKANSAAAGVGVIYFFSYLPFIFISIRYEKMNLFTKILACFVNNLGMAEGIQLIGMFEGKGTGIDWSNWTKGLSVDDDFSLFQVMVVLLADNFIYLIMFNYFEQVIPSDHGITKKWNFPIQSFFGSSETSNYTESNTSFLNETDKNQRDINTIRDINGMKFQSSTDLPVFIEDETIYSSKAIGIKINNITKTFKQLGTVKKAVDNLSLNIYEEQITVLLGHNGAGKSTTISMITGLSSPVKGNILINNIDIVKNTKEARMNIGLCPQHNLLFDSLTVYEHLKFFSTLKENFNELEIHEMLDLLNLKDKINTLSKSLSGGMKRKLSLAIAFIGGSKIVILDEPSSGMDPQARHSTWNLLQKFKKERKCTILLTTHFMDEADFLGDRIAIMSKGSLKCCGSPLFLKSKYGNGYSLVITKKKNYENEIEKGPHQENISINEKNQADNTIPDPPKYEYLENKNSSDKVIDLVKSIIPNAKLSSNINSEISFMLPTEDTVRFSDLFVRLENEKETLNILNIGVSVTTLEEVFLRIGDNENTDDVATSEHTLANIGVSNYSASNPVYEILCDDNISGNTARSNGYKNGDLFAEGSDSIASPSHNHTPNNNVVIEKGQSNHTGDLIDDYGLWIGSKEIHRVDPFQRLLNQFNILIKKRFIHSKRNLSLIVSQIIIPIAVLLINLLYLKYAPIKPGDSPLLKIEITRYGNNFVPYNLKYDKSPILIDQLSKIYATQFNPPNILPFNLQDNTSVTMCSDRRKNIDDFLVCLGHLSFNYIIDDYVVAADFISDTNDNLTLVGHFNNQPFHVPPLTVNLMTNTLFKYYTNSTENKIVVNNHPLPRNLQGKITDQQLKDQTGFNVGSGLTFGFSFLIASFVIFIIKERASNSKHLQYMSGCNSHVFWISSLLWDIINYMLAVIVVILLLWIFGIMEFLGSYRWLITIGLMVLYGFAHISQMYLFSYFFKVSSTGFATMVGWNILSSQATLTPVAILTLPQLNLIDVSNALEWLFIVIMPNFAFGQGLIDMYNNNQTTEICKDAVAFCKFQPNPCCGYYNVTNPNRCGSNATDCLLWTENYMSWEKPGLLRFFVFMPLQFFVQFGIILIYEAGYLRKLKYVIGSVFKKKDNSLRILQNQLLMEEQYGDIKKDSDVINEEIRINNMNALAQSSNKQEIFIINQLTKYYQNFMAVKGISFSIASSECFGLLGVNGAGKTSTFKMITGDEEITKGDAFLNSTSIKTNIKKFQQQLGYCPQFDPLIDQMTVYETMELFATLRGIRKNLIKRTCLSLIQLLDLNLHVNKMCYTLSGGNKRKLSVAIALVGSPIVVLLDEPTSGMDPKTRRTLWNCLNNIRSKGKSLILTTHSMDETEALCSNIGIMVNGELKCLGNLQHLKGKYGDGYTLLAKISLINNDQKMQIENINKFINFILEKFLNQSYVKENRDGFVNIHINDNSTRALSNIFSMIETVKVEFNVEYYVVTQTKLEQIFLNFASRQIDPETRIIKSNGCAGCC